MLEITRNEEAKKQTADPKRPRERPRQRPIEENRDETIAILFSDLDIELKRNINRRTRSRKAD